MAYGIGSTAAFGMVQDLAQLIIGMNPLENEIIWDKLYRTTFWGQNGGPVIFSGIAALDMALWDIKGKYFNVPIYKLLGGKFRDNLRCYASQLQYGWEDHRIPAVTVEDYVSNCLKVIKEGYDALKIDFFEFDEKDGRTFNKEERTRLLTPYYLNLLEKRIAAVREAVGSDVDIIIENHSSLDANGAVQLGKLIHKYNILFFEEPCTADPGLSKYVSENVNIPIANGERIYGRWQFAKYFGDNSIQVIQPDIGNCGGFTEVKKICDMAHTYDVSVQAHICASPLSTAAALQLEAAIPNFVIHEHHQVNNYPDNKKLAIKDLQPVKGRYKIPEGPGLGNEISEFCFENYYYKVVVK